MFHSAVLMSNETLQASEDAAGPFLEMSNEILATIHKHVTTVKVSSSPYCISTICTNTTTNHTTKNIEHFLLLTRSGSCV